MLCRKDSGIFHWKRVEHCCSRQMWPIWCPPPASVPSPFWVTPVLLPALAIESTDIGEFSQMFLVATPRTLSKIVLLESSGFREPSSSLQLLLSPIPFLKCICQVGEVIKLLFFFFHVAADTISGFFCVFTKRTTVAPFLAKEKTAIPPGSSKKIFFK